jgi:septal ring factor EnvC (AmiA/AmiB activator)
MPDIKEITEEITKTARDAAYVVVGLGVLGVQRAQVRRQELAKKLAEPRSQVETRIGDVRSEVTKRVKEVDGRVEDVIARLEASLEPLEQRLPEQARALVEQARTQAREARQQLRALLLSDAA